jgi:hypothetical protein
VTGCEMRARPIAVVFAVWVAALGAIGTTPGALQEPRAPAGEFRPPPPPEQPLPFSHRLHLTSRGLQCILCHDAVEDEDYASLPPTSTCMRCHAKTRVDSPHIQRLTRYDAQQEEVPWKRVYDLPDYVYFSHRRHVRVAKVTCDVCHGSVRELDSMQKLRDISMASCVECHKNSAAPVLCDSCHQPRPPA